MDVHDRVVLPLVTIHFLDRVKTHQLVILQLHVAEIIIIIIIIIIIGQQHF